jgi:hypothetical protein
MQGTFSKCTDVKIFRHISNQDTTALKKQVKKTKNNRVNVQVHNLVKTYKLNHTFGYTEINSKKSILILTLQADNHNV